MKTKQVKANKKYTQKKIMKSKKRQRIKKTQKNVFSVRKFRNSIYFPFK